MSKRANKKPRKNCQSSHPRKVRGCAYEDNSQKARVRKRREAMKKFKEAGKDE